eukprot:gene129-78_t
MHQESYVTGNYCPCATTQETLTRIREGAKGPCIEGGTRTNASKNTPDSLSPVKTDSLTSLQSNPNMYISKVIDIQ